MIRAHAAHVIPPEGGIVELPQTEANTYKSPSTIEISGHTCVRDYPELQKIITEEYGAQDWNNCFVINFHSTENHYVSHAQVRLELLMTEVFPLVQPDIVLVSMEASPQKGIWDYVDELGWKFPDLTIDLIYSEDHYNQYLQSAYSDFTCYIMIAYKKLTKIERPMNKQAMESFVREFIK